MTGGAERDRTDDLRLAKPALSQLSYSPESGALERYGRAAGVVVVAVHRARLLLRLGITPVSLQITYDSNDGCVTCEDGAALVGEGRLELPTSRLSGVCSNHLSYSPGFHEHAKPPERLDAIAESVRTCRSFKTGLYVLEL